MRGTDYRMPDRELAPGEEIDQTRFRVIEAMPVKSLITAPLDGFVLPRGDRVRIAGFAWNGNGQVAEVQVSADGGATWHEATLEASDGPFAWRAFSATLTVLPGDVTVMARAIADDGSMQPLETVWNPRGYCNNAVQRVRGLAK